MIKVAMEGDMGVIVDKAGKWIVIINGVMYGKFDFKQIKRIMRMLDEWEERT